MKVGGFLQEILCRQNVYSNKKNLQKIVDITVNYDNSASNNNSKNKNAGGKEAEGV